MLHHTEGIVLGSLKYKESSLIVKIFTNAFGMQSYVVNGVRSSKSQGKTALYQPLTLLDMVVYHKGFWKGITGRIGKHRFILFFKKWLYST